MSLNLRINVPAWVEIEALVPPGPNRASLQSLGIQKTNHSILDLHTETSFATNYKYEIWVS